jgi:hypothetical protein
MSLRINSTETWTTRRLLRSPLRDLAKLNIVSVDHKRNRSCFQIFADRADVGAIMGAVISSLPEAEFGPVRDLA